MRISGRKVGGIQIEVEHRPPPDATAAPLSTPFAPLASGPVGKAAERELAGYLRDLGLPPTTDNPLQAIQDAELSAGKNIDPRVGVADMKVACERATRALSLTPAPQSALFGFTRLVDAKFQLTPAVVAALAASALDRPGRATELFGDIDRGPPEGTIAWRRPGSRTELVASLVRQLLLGGGASLQLQIDAELALWLDATLKKIQSPTAYAMGGAGAFCTNLANALPNVSARFFAPTPLPTAVALRFAAGVEVVDSAGGVHRPRTFKDDTAAARVNYAAEYRGDQAQPEPFTILGRRRLKVNGKSTPLAVVATGRVLLGTPSDEQPGFGGAKGPALEKLATDNDLVFLAGTHYFTKDSPDGCQARATELAAEVRALHRANPKLVVHHSYVVPKKIEHEGLLLAGLKGAFDSFSLNAVELPGLLTTLVRQGMSAFAGDAGDTREGAEAPAAVLAGALALKDAMQLPRVHIHGLYGDLIVLDRALEGVLPVEQQVLACVKARQLASNKAANETGEIRAAADVWPVAPVVRGEALAAVQAFADAVVAEMAKKGVRVSAAERTLVCERWWYRDAATGNVLLFVPSRGIHDRTGGTTSLGDTIDASALIYALAPNRVRRPVHPSAHRHV
ncbi:MAG: hypothetical protein HY903_07470 [Deltaproteobacteria bacterium]|nr:hypothetical protein [Deltaproteobacteria bacterium]